MNKRQRPVAESLVRASDFAATRLSDFTHQPPTKVDLKFISARDRVAAAIALLGGKLAIQAGGAYHEETDNQGILRDELEEELRDINSTAASIAEETANPAMMARFRMPHGQSDSDLAVSARAFAVAIRELELNDEFEAHGHPQDTATDLEEMIEEFSGSEGGQGTALGNRAGATAAIPGALRAGKSAVKTLNAIFRRVYKGNLEVLTAWKTASHVQRVPRAAKPVTLPTGP
jgi:hypothetical protein